MDSNDSFERDNIHIFDQEEVPKYEQVVESGDNSIVSPISDKDYIDGSLKETYDKPEINKKEEDIDKDILKSIIDTIPNMNQNTDLQENSCEEFDVKAFLDSVDVKTENEIQTDVIEVNDSSYEEIKEMLNDLKNSVIKYENGETKDNINVVSKKI